MTQQRGALRVVSLAVLAVVSCLIALRIGDAHIEWSTALGDANSFDRAILSARAARVLLGAISGGALAASGASFQALLRNPMGDPYALGVSGGAALGATLAVLLGWGTALIPLSAFAGAMGATLGVLAIARTTGRASAHGLLLAGLVFNACANALLAFLRSSLNVVKAQETLSLLLGFVGEEQWSTVARVAAFVSVGSVILLSLTHRMNVLSLGRESALALGVQVSRVETLIFLASSLVVGGVVSVCGLIPFVGLIVPHFVRAYTGPDHRLLVPASFFGGAALLVLADATARALYGWMGSEPPVGAITAILGAPVFFLAMRKMHVNE